MSDNGCCSESRRELIRRGKSVGSAHEAHHAWKTSYDCCHGKYEVTIPEDLCAWSCQANALGCDDGTAKNGEAPGKFKTGLSRSSLKWRMRSARHVVGTRARWA